MKKLDLNNSKDLSALKESLNRTIDKRIAEQRLNEKFDEISNLSFGEYKSLYEDTLTKLSESIEGKKNIASYVKMLRENNALKTVYRILEHANVRKDADSNIVAYGLAQILENINKPQLQEGESKMFDIYKQACSIVGDVTPERIDTVLAEGREVNDAVKFLVNEGKTSNIDLLSERAYSIGVLGKLIEEGKKETVEESINEKTTSELVSDLCNLFESGNSDWENRVLSDLSVCCMSNGNIEELFESYKQACIDTIDQLDENSDFDKKSRLHGMKQQLSEKTYNKETVTDDLFKLAELKETLLSE